MKKLFIPSCILVIIILIIITGFYQYETYKLEEKNSQSNLKLSRIAAVLQEKIDK